jgi:hypothetical protein
MLFSWIDDAKVGMSIRVHLSDFAECFFADKWGYPKKLGSGQIVEMKVVMVFLNRFLFKTIF